MEDVESLERPACGPDKYVVTPSKHPHEWKSRECQISASCNKITPSLLSKRLASVCEIAVESRYASSTHDDREYPETEDDEGDQPCGDGAPEKMTRMIVADRCRGRDMGSEPTSH